MLAMSRTSFDAIDKANVNREGAIHPLRLMADLDDAAKVGCESINKLPSDLPLAIK